MKHACKHSPKHVVMVMAYLRGLGAEVGDITRSRCLHLAFSYGGRPFVLPIRHTDPVDKAMRSARKLVRKMLHAAGLTMPQALAAPA